MELSSRSGMIWEELKKNMEFSILGPLSRQHIKKIIFHFEQNKMVISFRPFHLGQNEMNILFIYLQKLGLENRHRIDMTREAFKKTNYKSVHNHRHNH